MSLSEWKPMETIPLDRPVLVEWGYIKCDDWPGGVRVSIAKRAKWLREPNEVELLDKAGQSGRVVVGIRWCTIPY